MHTVLWSYVFVAVGGALGAVARFSLNVFLQRDVAFPWGTLGANLLGCLIMGMLAHLIAHSQWFNARRRLRLFLPRFYGAALASSSAVIRSTQSSCSGFMSTERRHVTVSVFIVMSGA